MSWSLAIIENALIIFSPYSHNSSEKISQVSLIYTSLIWREGGCLGEEVNKLGDQVFGGRSFGHGRIKKYVVLQSVQGEETIA